MKDFVSRATLAFEDFLRIGREEGYSPDVLAYLWSDVPARRWVETVTAKVSLAEQEQLLRETFRECKVDWDRGL